MASSPQTLTLSFENEFSSVKHDKQISNFFSMSSISAPFFESEDRAKRAGMDIVCVLDRSGSMGGAKMKMLHETVELVITNLKECDKLSLVSYDTEVETNLPLMKMDNAGKKRARLALKNIRDRGLTNLSGGLLRGLEVLAERTEDKNEVCSVLLMTDGLANRGITDSAGIVKAVKLQIEAMNNPTTIYTFGYGTDHDANMLKEIAEAAGGVYYFLENTDSIVQAFADCVGGLVSVVAQNIQLTITAAEGVSINNISTQFTKTENDKGKKYTLEIGDIFSEEERDLLVDLKLPALDSPTDTHPLLGLHLKFYDVMGSAWQHMDTVATLPRTGDGVRSVKVDEQKNRISTAKAMDQARLHGDAGNLTQAQECLQMCYNSIETSMSHGAPQSVALMHDIRSLTEDMRTHSLYKKKGSKKLMSKGRTHWAQRCGKTAGDDEEDMYTTSSKSAFKQAWKK